MTECYALLGLIYLAGLVPLLPLRLPATRRPSKVEARFGNSLILGRPGWARKPPFVRCMTSISSVISGNPAFRNDATRLDLPCPDPPRKRGVCGQVAWSHQLR